MTDLDKRDMEFEIPLPPGEQEEQEPQETAEAEAVAVPPPELPDVVEASQKPERDVLPAAEASQKPERDVLPAAEASQKPEPTAGEFYTDQVQRAARQEAAAKQPMAKPLRGASKLADEIAPQAAASRAPDLDEAIQEVPEVQQSLQEELPSPKAGVEPPLPPRPASSDVPPPRPTGPLFPPPRTPEQGRAPSMDVSYEEVPAPSPDVELPQEAAEEPETGGIEMPEPEEIGQPRPDLQQPPIDVGVNIGRGGDRSRRASPAERAAARRQRLADRGLASTQARAQARRREFAEANKAAWDDVDAIQEERQFAEPQEQSPPVARAPSPASLPPAIAPEQGRAPSPASLPQAPVEGQARAPSPASLPLPRLDDHVPSAPAARLPGVGESQAASPPGLGASGQGKEQDTAQRDMLDALRNIERSIDSLIRIAEEQKEQLSAIAEALPNAFGLG